MSDPQRMLPNALPALARTIEGAVITMAPVPFTTTAPAVNEIAPLAVIAIKPWGEVILIPVGSVTCELPDTTLVSVPATTVLVSVPVNTVFVLLAGPTYVSDLPPNVLVYSSLGPPA